MFENLTDRLGSSLKNLAGQGALTEDNIRDTLREVRKALLEADVALPVVKEFVEQVKEKALGQEVLKSLNPGQAFVKIVNDELVHTMGDANDALNLATKPPAIILMAGLQGAGKTTSVAKLARFLQEREKKKVMVVTAIGPVIQTGVPMRLETIDACPKPGSWSLLSGRRVITRGYCHPHLHRFTSE